MRCVMCLLYSGGLWQFYDLWGRHIFTLIYLYHLRPVCSDVEVLLATTPFILSDGQEVCIYVCMASANMHLQSLGWLCKLLFYTACQLFHLYVIWSVLQLSSCFVPWITPWPFYLPEESFLDLVLCRIILMNTLRFRPIGSIKERDLVFLHKLLYV